MAFYQMDSSAVAKRYVMETGSDWVRSLCAPTAGNIIGIARITFAEVASVLARKHREGTITQQERDHSLMMFLYDCSEQYQILEIDRVVVDKAVQLTQRHPLRGYDAVQLAAAAIVNQGLVANGLPSPVFVSSDDKLCTAAASEGLVVENPNLHV